MPSPDPLSRPSATLRPLSLFISTCQPIVSQHWPTSRHIPQPLHLPFNHLIRFTTTASEIIPEFISSRGMLEVEVAGMVTSAMDNEWTWYRGQLDKEDGDMKTNISTGNRSPPTRPTIGQLDMGDGDTKTDISTGNRSPPMRPTIGQLDMGDDDRKTSISTGNKSPPT
ncbi:hypothetical protein F5141DRAFT_1066823 [Pisolithus sp. B1]|nr:hypothetical protein F5141DRAFT_1066823 [Pisolithus sp. B1]